MGSFVSKMTSKASTTTEKTETVTGPQPFRHYAQAQTKFSPPLIANNNAFLGDVFSK